MHNTQQGFMLINFCVYLVFFAIITTLITTLMFRTYQMYTTRGTLQANLEDAYVAQDVFMYDLQQAPIQLSSWTHHDTTKIGWVHEGTSVQWYFEDDKLIRLSVQNKQRQCNTAARGIRDGEFVIQTKGNRIYMISLRMKVRGIKRTTELETAYGFYGMS